MASDGAADPPLDTVRRVTTPEGCELSLRLAGPTTRARAWFLDFLVRLAIYAVILGFLARLGVANRGVAILLAFVLEWLYPVVFEVLWRGATPGKRLLRIAVLHDDGRPVGWGASMARNTLRFVDFLPFGYAFGLLSMLLDRDGRRLGDLLAGTVVVHVAEPPQALANDACAAAEAPPFALTLVEQRALLEYRFRAGSLTEARADELAELARPLTAGLPPGAGRQRLLRIGNFVLGRRD